MKCQTTFGNTVQIPVTILLQETSWTVVPPSPFAPLSRIVHDLHLFSASLSFAPVAIQKEPPAASVLSESFLWAQKKKKSVQTSSQLASSCWSQEKREGDRQTVTTTTLATENKSIQLIVCADVKVCVCECKSLINTIFYNCSVIVCVCASESVSVDWMQHWKNNRNWEKIQQKNQIQQLQLQRQTAPMPFRYWGKHLLCRLNAVNVVYKVCDHKKQTMWNLHLHLWLFSVRPIDKFLRWPRTKDLHSRVAV